MKKTEAEKPAMNEKFKKISKWVRTLARIGRAGAVIGAISMLFLAGVAAFAPAGVEASTDIMNEFAGTSIQSFMPQASAGTMRMIATFACVCATALFIILTFLLDSVARLFDNFYNNTTPFTLGNIRLIKKIAKTSLIMLIVQLATFGISSSGVSSGINIITVLIIYAFAYIFDYGYQMQRANEK